ncbi:hypothetical protein J5N97_012635 [Dioscorea zingiberensis]|uniref:GUN4-like domain-containing protein n=1 Tax=Dioscorea zingiberensis TaxID=325984 RepID=A0A9D5HHW8_9LILI|nr:hypothetical protein J5N97_012635 [Dioscorea zingiberensis]
MRRHAVSSLSLPEKQRRSGAMSSSPKSSSSPPLTSRNRAASGAATAVTASATACRDGYGSGRHGEILTGFFIRVGWMKKLDTEMEQYNYRAFPDEFIWELADDTPEGHLPLTNALRGTQLLANIFTHPAFEEEMEEEEGEEKEEVERKEEVKPKERPKFIKSFKQDYSF